MSKADMIFAESWFTSSPTVISMTAISPSSGNSLSEYNELKDKIPVAI